MRRVLIPIGLAACLLSACSSTKMISTWKADGFQRGSIKKVLVIGVFKTEGVREVVEGQMVELLKEDRVEGAASNAFFKASDLQRDAVVQKVRELQYDGVLLTRVLDSELLAKHYPPASEPTKVQVGYYDDWYKDYQVSQEEIAAIGHSVQSEGKARVETKLYDARTQKMVYSAVSETTIDGRDVEQIRGAVGTLVEQMVRNGIF